MYVVPTSAARGTHILIDILVAQLDKGIKSICRFDPTEKNEMANESREIL